MKIRVIYYRSKWGDGHSIDNLISMYTGLFNWFTPNYSHVELWIPDDDGKFERDTDILRPQSVPIGPDGWLEPQSKYLGQSFTSTMGQTGGRNGKGGTCLRPAYDILRNPHRWDYQEVECSDVKYKALLEAIDEAVANNKGYSKKTITAFFNPIKRKPSKDGKKICSGQVWRTLYDVYILKVNLLFSPRRMSKRFKKYMLYPGDASEIRPLLK